MMIIIIATKYYNSGPLATLRALGEKRAVRFSHVNLTGRASPLGTRAIPISTVARDLTL